MKKVRYTPIIPLFLFLLLQIRFDINAQEYFCGNTPAGSHSGAGFYTYPNDTIALDFTPAGTSISILCTALDVPNRFTIYNSGGGFVVTSGWIGYATYPGPWGSSLNGPATKTISFTKGTTSMFFLKVETSIQSTSDSWNASVNCPIVTPQIPVISIQNQTITNTMIAAFQALSPAVNFAQLSTELGLNYTLTSNDIDFQHLLKSYISNDNDSGQAITAPFKKNSNDSLKNYGFSLSTDGSSYIKPMIVKVITNQTIEYFDLETSRIGTVNNYTGSNLTTSIHTGLFRQQPKQDCTGQGILNCIIDAYSNHGFWSIWAFIQSSFLPATAVAIAGACAIKNCIPR